MRDKIFFDTNILYYAYDASEPQKRKICEDILEKVSRGELLGTVSNQILGELFNVSVSKLGVPVEEAKIIVQSLIVSEKWHKINYNVNTVNRAITNFGQGKTPFWDLLIAETMKENGITEIITENERDFNRIPGIKVTNPFKQ